MQIVLVARSLAELRQVQEDNTGWVAASLNRDLLRLDIALRSTRHIAARRGRIGQYEWADVMHDEHGPIGKRLVMISRK